MGFASTPACCSHRRPLVPPSSLHFLYASLPCSALVSLQYPTLIRPPQASSCSKFSQAFTVMMSAVRKCLFHPVIVAKWDLSSSLLSAQAASVLAISLVQRALMFLISQALQFLYFFSWAILILCSVMLILLSSLFHNNFCHVHLKKHRSLAHSCILAVFRLSH